MTELAKAGVEIQRARVNLRDYLLSSQINQTSTEQQAYKRRYRALAQQVNDRIHRLNQETQTPQETELINNIQKQWETLKQVIDDIEQAIESNNHQQATTWMLTRCYTAATELTDSLYQLDERFEKTTHQTLEQQCQDPPDYKLS